MWTWTAPNSIFSISLGLWGHRNQIRSYTDCAFRLISIDSPICLTLKNEHSNVFRKGVLFLRGPRVRLERRDVSLSGLPRRLPQLFAVFERQSVVCTVFGIEQASNRCAVVQRMAVISETSKGSRVRLPDEVTLKDDSSTCAKCIFSHHTDKPVIRCRRRLWPSCGETKI